MTITLRSGVLFRATDDDKKPGYTRFLISDDSLDRYQTRIVQDWDLDAFQRNPVAPWSHDYSRPPLGRWRDLEVRDLGDGRRGTVATLEWDMDDPEAAAIAGKYDRGIMQAVSVGFRSGSQTPLRELSDDHPWKSERGTMLSDNELYEISPVTIPGNGNAVQQGRGLTWIGAALVETAPEELRAELVRLLTEDDDVRRMVREMCGDLQTTTQAREEARHLHPFSWLSHNQ